MACSTHRTAVGSRVVVSYEEGGQRVEQVQEVGLMGGFSASADPRMHFGLGRHAGPVTATLHWYGGEVQTVQLEADRYHWSASRRVPRRCREGDDGMLSALKGAIVRRDGLTEHQRSQMLSLMQLCYAGVSAERFTKDLEEKQYVILLSVRRTGELAGFSTLRVAEGLMGRQARGARVLGRHRHPPGPLGTEGAAGPVRPLHRRGAGCAGRCVPLLWLLLSGGYKTYLLSVNNFPRTLPRYDWEPPAERVAFMRELASRWFGSQYDAERGILRFEGQNYRVRDGIAPIDRAAAAHPHIAFFAERNPGHVDGEELVCLTEVRLRDLALAVGRILVKQVRGLTRRGLRLIGVRARA